MVNNIYNRKVLGWMMYDWATQPYSTLLLSFIFGPYFISSVVDDPVIGQSMWAWMLAISGLILALSSPIFGALSDTIGTKRPWLLVFSGLYFFGAFGLWWAVPAADNAILFLLIFAFGYLGMEWIQVFANAILPLLNGREDVGRLSGDGWAFGYLGGLLMLVTALVFFVDNTNGTTIFNQPPAFGLDGALREGTRIIGPLCAIWFVVFMIPFFTWAPMGVQIEASKGTLRRALCDLLQTILTLPKNRSFMAYLGSSLLYRDALFALYSFGGIYAAGVLKWELTQIGVFGILGIVSAIIFTFLSGFWQNNFGAKPVIVGSIVVLIVVSIIIITITPNSVLGIGVAAESFLPDILFMALGCILGGCGGVLQATSRTMLIYQANPRRITEAFGLYALAGKSTAFIAPFLIALATQLSGSQHLGIIPVIFLFSFGLIWFIWVKPKK